ncbi:hypothetical protein B7463_g12191, partial [Scytalidium lignicola]
MTASFILGMAKVSRLDKSSKVQEEGKFTTIKNGEDIYVILVKFITGSPKHPNTALESVLYRVEDGYLEELLKFPTFGGTDATSITVQDQTWLIITESLAKDQRFRVDSKVYRFNPPALVRNKIVGDTTWQSPEFLTLFETYTASNTSLGTQLALAMSNTTASFPLLTATSSSMIFYPGNGQDPSSISFRLSNRGFKELAAISHFGPALASLVQMYTANSSSDTWRTEAQRLLKATERTAAANSTELWRDKIRVRAFRGREASIAAMVDYSCTITIKYLKAVLEDPAKLAPEFLRREYLEATGTALVATIPINAVMIATFFLVGLDTAHRMRVWLEDQMVDWSKAMVVIVGRQGSETAGVTITTSSVAQIILQSSNLELPIDRLYIAPHGPDVVVTGFEDIESIRKYEEPMRLLWNRNRAMYQLGSTMFSGYPAYKPLSGRPEITSLVAEVSELPVIHGPQDWLSMTTRMRIVLEDVRQLLSGCVTDYAAEQLRLRNNNPAAVVVPGLDLFDYPSAPKIPIYPITPVNNHLVLEASPVDIETEFGFPGRKCSNGTAEIAFWEEGNGKETIIWIHGLPLASQSWGAQRRHFSTRYRNIYMDLRGYGESSKLPAGIEDVTQLYCNDLKFLFEHLRLPKSNIVGFASAGHVALRFAAQNAHLVEKLVVINGSPCFRRREDWPWGFSETSIAQFTSAALESGIESITKTDSLRGIPGPFLAKWTNLWLILLDNSGKRSETLHKLHKEYGPVIRIGPNQLSFSSRQAMHDIYSGNSNYVKAPAYGAPASVAQVEPIVSEHVSKLVDALESNIARPVDMLLWFRMLALDVTSDIFLGKSFKCLENEKPPPILHDLDEVFPAYWIEWQFPVFFRLLLLVPHKQLQNFITAGHRFYKYGAEAFNDYICRYGRDGSRRDLLQKMIAVSREPGEPIPLPDQDIVVEITNLLFAGIDTTGNTFTYLFWELAKHPKWQKRLQKELDAAGFERLPAYRDVMDLPVLDALIHETLRVWPASPASLPRVAPKGGGIIDGVKVPENTIVSCQSLTLQRDPAIFPDPDSFLPERWLHDSGKDDMNAMRDMIFVWGKGQRICMGKPIATMELKMGTAAIMKRYNVEIGDKSTDEDMEIRDHFVLMAKGGKCILRFTRRAK